MLVAEALADGQSVQRIVTRISKGDKAAAKRWRQKIRAWTATSPAFRALLMQHAEAEMQLALGSTVAAVNRRAARGRMDAAKVVMAKTGFHSDKVDHNHSGSIDINVSIPRPQAVQDHLNPGTEPIVEADVVED